MTMRIEVAKQWWLSVCLSTVVVVPLVVPFVLRAPSVSALILHQATPSKAPFLKVLYLLYVIFVLAGMPYGLWLFARTVWLRSSTAWLISGVTLGMAVGLWLNTVAISIPYTGLFPSLPSVMVAVRMSGSRDQTPQYWLWLYGTNLVGWTTLGAGVSWAYRKRFAR
jgi:hypothetical protein